MLRLLARAAVTLGIFVSAAMLAGADDLTGVSTVISSARTSAMGGPHAALADDLTTVFDNPAGFESAPPEIALSELSLRLTGPIFDIAGVAEGGLGGDISSLLASTNVQNLLESIYASMNLAGPIYFGYVGHGLGFGIFNSSSFTLTNTAPLTLAAATKEQLLLIGGYAFRIPLPPVLNSTLDAGISMKGTLQGTSYIEKSIFELPSLFSSIGASTFEDAPFYFDSAIGFDAGLRYSYANLVSVGIVGRNIYTPDLRTEYPTLQDFLDNSSTSATTTNMLLPFDLSVGTLFTPPLGFLSSYLSGLKIMLDYNDALGFLTHPATANNPWLNIGFGTEVTLLQILDLRGGFYQGLFTAGLGLDLKYFHIDAAMFGTELSTEPGLDPVFNLLVSVSFILS
jgi:hypothetical protein